MKIEASCASLKLTESSVEILQLLLPSPIKLLFKDTNHVFPICEDIPILEEKVCVYAIQLSYNFSVLSSCQSMAYNIHYMSSLCSQFQINTTVQ